MKCKLKVLVGKTGDRLVIGRRGDLFQKHINLTFIKKHRSSLILFGRDCLKDLVLQWGRPL